MLPVQEIYSVSELTREIKIILEESFDDIQIKGELSNFKAHGSGHWYFCLKDSDATINCTMWRSINSNVFFVPQDGMKVVVTGKISVYPPRGTYQIDVRSMKPAGVGELQAAFEALKEKLYNEGLFAPERKRSIPEIPRSIGIVSAPDSAAFNDLVSIASRRFPLVKLFVAPARVQGAGGAESIVEAIKRINMEKGIDVIIIARGGGSIEDLWCFNEEKVARAIYNSKIPVISGVGHETDFTIADFVSDLRAPTPSAAMEIATPDWRELADFIQNSASSNLSRIKNLLKNRNEKVRRVLNSYGFRIPFDLYRRYSQQLDSASYKIMSILDKKMLKFEQKTSSLSSVVEAHDIQKTLKKGFVLLKQNGNYIKRKNDFDKNSVKVLRFFDGEVDIE